MALNSNLPAQTHPADPVRQDVVTASPLPQTRSGRQGSQEAALVVARIFLSPRVPATSESREGLWAPRGEPSGSRHRVITLPEVHTARYATQNVTPGKDELQPG